MGRALIRKPKVFLMDEPLSNLDAQLRVEMRSQISILQKELGVTTIYVTHDQVEAMTMGDRVAIINEGKLIQVDNPSTLYNKPNDTFVASFIGSPKINFLLLNKIIDFNQDVENKMEKITSVKDRDELIFGVRPEDFVVEKKPDTLTINIKPILVEDLGFSKDIIFSLTNDNSNTNFIARLPTDIQITAHQPTDIHFPINKIIFFDSKTNQRIEI